MGKNIIIFVAYLSSSVHIHNNLKDILILCEEATQRINCTPLTAKAKYLIDFT